MYKQRSPKRRLRVYPATILITALILSIASPVRSFTCGCEDGTGNEQKVLITAYYSPLPDQKRYALGSYDDDIMFNGRGIAGADGTPVYPGMMAAPPEIPFGTIVELPSYGVVGTVHDRGGWIETLDDGTIRIDIWMGKGEEGLARALEFGAQRSTAILHYPLDAIAKEDFDLSKFPAPEKALAHLPSNPISMLDIKDPQYGDTSPQVASIQHALRKLGYFDHEITSFFGTVTKEALYDYQRDLRIGLHGERADEDTRLSLVAQRIIADELSDPLGEEEVLLLGQAGKSIRVAQRILKLIGSYEGPIDGEFDAHMMQIIYTFQRDRNIVASLSDTGAGIIGPQTRRALLTAWRDYRIERRGGDSVVAGLERSDLVASR